MNLSAVEVSQLASRYVEDSTFFKLSLSPVEKTSLRLAYTRETGEYSYAGKSWDAWVKQKALVYSSAAAA
jgi:hypothetical protein